MESVRIAVSVGGMIMVVLVSATVCRSASPAFFGGGVDAGLVVTSLVNDAMMRFSSSPMTPAQCRLSPDGVAAKGAARYSEFV